jgi:hypothetical protein
MLPLPDSGQVRASHTVFARLQAIVVLRLAMRAFHPDIGKRQERFV